MPLTSKTFKLCNAVKEALEAAFSEDLATVEVKPSGVFNVKENGVFEAFVIPGASLYEPDSRTGVSADQEILVALAKSLDDVTMENIDVCAGMLEEIVKELFNTELNVDGEKFLPLNIENDNVYDDEILYSRLQYITYITITYKVDVI